MSDLSIAGEGERDRRSRGSRCGSVRRRRRTARLCAALLASGLVACDTGALTAGPTDRCTEAGVQCQLPAGPLGVCERAPCGPGETAPCFQCTPQH
jgi:hypothetical protein